ncbi:MAG: sigma 54-interacting transcriptional regulator [Magnetococcales bacterium]|nr:sigma 54-interacting transcriptional regulator [Magnetococcales bacterium]MBF0156997.1 sigma 54-interacting transcriptional regulator [Magnetococcales bacterium]
MSPKKRENNAAAFAQLVHASEVMKLLLQRAEKAARYDVPVFIQGDSGTGKELLANGIHRASHRAEGPFVSVNCGAIPANLVESELFGHEKGAFTGAVQTRKGYFLEAQGGTLFLDEVGELPLPTQVKLLRALQTSEVTPIGSEKPRTTDFRLITATNRNLTKVMAEGLFREDLFHRIAVVVIGMPALRERGKDIRLLIDLFLDEINRLERLPEGLDPLKFTDHSREVLESHHWPGNVRELKNTIRRLAIWAEEPTIRAKEAREALLPDHTLPAQEILNRPFRIGFKLTSILTEVADHYIRRALQESQNNKSLATRLLGMPNSTTFANWLKKYPWTERK